MGAFTKIRDWISYLETISADNIKDQTLYIELISLSCLNLKDQGVSLYQFSSLDCLFGKNGTNPDLISFKTFPNSKVIYVVFKHSST
jgi:hypothetical protein